MKAGQLGSPLNLMILTTNNFNHGEQEDGAA